MKKTGFNPFILSLLPLLFFGFNALEAEVFSFEFMTGSAYNVPTLLTVHQTGYPDVELSAVYNTEPFDSFTPYYSWRASLWNKDQAWEVQQIHHRIFLMNLPPEIQAFAIHFGYNFFMVGHAWRRNGFVYHLDAGVLINNPSNTVRGQVLNTAGQGLFDQGYYLSGVAVEAAVSRDIYFTPNSYVVLEVNFTSGWTNDPVANGSADVPNIAIHGHVGMGFSI